MFSGGNICAVIVALAGAVGALQARPQIPRYLAIPRSPAPYAIQLATGTGAASSSLPASSYSPPPFANTTTAGAGSTTLTISATSVQTIISCAPTVTNCPGASGTGAVPTSLPEGVSTSLATTVVGVTTTVCPVSEASAVSSSVLASFSSPLPTEATTAPAGGCVATETVTSVVTTTMISISTVEAPGTCACPAATASAAAYDTNDKYKLRRSVP
ncbi:hypothetical protein F5Y14DRAFT_275191 [Nemania sp. NC0429]|nr:hypothetical protein F5Y14DRAFT_275191 [Nemania sp. NC0429]